MIRIRDFMASLALFSLLGNFSVIYAQPGQRVSQFSIRRELAAEGILLPRIILDQNQLNFRQAEVGRAMQQTLTVRNDGLAPLMVSEVRSDLLDIRVLQPSFAVEPGGSQTITVTFVPQAEGTISGVLEVLSNDPDQPKLSVTVAGMAVVIPADPRADFDGNGRIEFADFLSLVNAFGTTDAAFDLDGSDRVEFEDFLIFARSFGKSVR